MSSMGFMSGREKARKVGARIPTGRMPPPDHLGPNGCVIWAAIMRARPNFYCDADRTLLTVYCIYSAEVDAWTRGEFKMDAKEVKEKLSEIRAIGTALRISPYASQTADGSVPSAHTAQETLSDGGVEQASGEVAAASPWMSP